MLVKAVMCDTGIDAFVVCVERYERTVRVQRPRADDAKGRGALWGLGTPGFTQLVWFLSGKCFVILQTQTLKLLTLKLDPECECYVQLHLWLKIK